MEIEIKPLTLDDRMLHLQEISKNKVANKKPFPWAIAITCVLIGACIWAIVEHQRSNNKENQKNE